MVLGVSYCSTSGFSFMNPLLLTIEMKENPLKHDIDL